MLPIHISVKIAFSSFLLFILQADSIQISPNQVINHFSQNQSYVYLAARYGDSRASMYLFDKTDESRWLQLAAKQGDSNAAYLWYLRDEGKHGVWLDFAANKGNSEAIKKQFQLTLADKQWLKAQQLLEQRRSQSNIKQQELQPTFSEVETMVKLALRPAEDVQLESLTIERNSGLAIDYQCRVKVQSYAATSELIEQVSNFKSALTRSAMADLPICFNETVLLPELQSICRKDQQQRIECDLKKLASLPQVNEPEQSFSHILVMVETGEANTRGGLMFMDKQDSTDVFIHELAHWFGLVDEYRIGRVQQAQLCHVEEHGFLGLNLFVTTKKYTRSQAEALAGRPLFPAATCEGSQYNAYKFTKVTSFMQYLEKPVSDFYLSLIKQNINWSNVVPAAMNFAHIYQGNYDLYLSYVKQAAASGYQGAITEFSQHLVEQGSYLEAKNWLEFGAEQGGTNSQLLLGHAYLEGSWLPRDLSESAQWYKKAAEQNDGYGLYFYGKCLEMGWGCIRSREQAFEYYRKSAKLGNKLAKRKLNSAL